MFDFGGVLYRISHQETVKRFAHKCKKSDAEFLNIYGETLRKTNAEFEIGAVSAAEFREKVKNALAIEISDKDFDDAWNLTLREIFPFSIEIISLFAKKFNISLLSNTNRIHYDYFKGECADLFKMFEKLFFSFEMGVRKPEIEIFRRAINESGYSPEKTLFVDDTEENLLAAKKLGIKTYLIDENSNLKTLAKELNV